MNESCLNCDNVEGNGCNERESINPRCTKVCFFFLLFLLLCFNWIFVLVYDERTSYFKAVGNNLKLPNVCVPWHQCGMRRESKRIVVVHWSVSAHLRANQQQQHDRLHVFLLSNFFLIFFYLLCLLWRYSQFINSGASQGDTRIHKAINRLSTLTSISGYGESLGGSLPKLHHLTQLDSVSIVQSSLSSIVNTRFPRSLRTYTCKGDVIGGNAPRK